jgi:very-short-patch-repair endonuclease
MKIHNINESIIYDMINFEKSEKELGMTRGYINSLSFNSLKKLWFICKCGKERFSEISNYHNYPKCKDCWSKYKYNCYLEKLDDSKKFINLYPELWKQIDFEKCEKELGLTKDRLAMFPKNNTYNIYWKCEYNHSWFISMGSRAHTRNISSCPFCSRKFSSIEIRLWSELTYYYSDAIWHHNIGKYEVDIFIPSLNLIIEYDGYKWHKERIKEDTEKNQYLSTLGFKIVRIRESELLPITNMDCQVPLNASHLEIMKESFTHLSKVLQKEFTFNQFKCEQLYNEKTACLLGNSNNPMRKEAIEAWDSVKNNPIKAEQIDKFSNKQYWFFCPTCGKSSLRRVFHVNKGLNCKKCKNKNLGESRLVHI